MKAEVWGAHRVPRAGRGLRAATNFLRLAIRARATRLGTCRRVFRRGALAELRVEESPSPRDACAPRTLPFAIHLAVAAAVFLSLLPAARGAESSAGFGAFSLLRSRNVFDPDRRAARSETESSQVKTTTAARPNFITLTGTMVTATKTLAFFTGSKAEFSKVLAVGETIADLKVASIRAGEVQLEKDAKPVALAVGAQLPVAGTLPAEPPPQKDAGATAPEKKAEPPADAAATPAGDKSDVLRRMMERRKKENSK